MCPNYCRTCAPPVDRTHNRTKCPLNSGPLLVKASDTALTLAVWTDGAFMEVFWAGGRAAWTVPLPCEAIERGGWASAFVSGGGSVTLLNATAWRVDAVEVEDIGDPEART